MTSWDSYPDFLEKLGVPLLLRKLATMGTPIVEVCKPIVHYSKYSLDTLCNTFKVSC